MSQSLALKMTAEELGAFLDQQFPQANDLERRFIVEAVGERTARVRMAYSHSMLRPGGTISGPAMFALADVAMYVVVLAHVGPRAHAVTTNLNINFLRKPSPGDIIGDATLLKLGKRLAVGEISLHSEQDEEFVAHATATYAIPET